MVLQWGSGMCDLEKTQLGRIALICSLLGLLNIGFSSGHTCFSRNPGWWDSSRPGKMSVSNNTEVTGWIEDFNALQGFHVELTGYTSALLPPLQTNCRSSPVSKDMKKNKCCLYWSMEPYGYVVGATDPHSNSQNMKTMNQKKFTPLSWLGIHNILPRLCIAYLTIVNRP